MPDSPRKLRITRRRLPHWTLEGETYFVTFRLAARQLGPEEVVLVRDRIVAGAARHYDLQAALVMPDHVHLLLCPRAGVSLSRVMKGIKGVTARRLNQRWGSRGKVWQEESFDRIVRDQAEFDEKLRYMFGNPLKAGLTDDPWMYPGWYMKGQTGMSALLV